MLGEAELKLTETTSVLFAQDKEFVDYKGEKMHRSKPTTTRVSSMPRTQGPRDLLNPKVWVYRRVDDGC